MTLRILALILAFGVSAQAQSTPSSQQTQQLPDAPSTTSNAHAPVVPTGPTVRHRHLHGPPHLQALRHSRPPSPSPTSSASPKAPRTGPTASNSEEVHGKRFYDGTHLPPRHPRLHDPGRRPRSATAPATPATIFQDEIDPALTFDQPGRLAMANSGPAAPTAPSSSSPKTPSPSSTASTPSSASATPTPSCSSPPSPASNATRSDKPLTPVVINHVTIVREGQPMPPEPAIAAPPPHPHRSNVHAPHSGALASR